MAEIKENGKRGRKPLFRREVLNDEKDIVQTMQGEGNKYTVCLFLPKVVKKFEFSTRFFAVEQMRKNRKLYGKLITK